MFSFLLSTVLFLQLSPSLSLALPYRFERDAVTRRQSYDIPFTRSLQKRDGLSGSIGLGDNSDLLYSVPVEFETAGITAALHLDTGSSDLWIISDKCMSGACAQSNSARYPSAALNSTGASVRLQYGDSTTGTFAQGPVGEETVTVAGIAMPGQHFAAIDSTSNSIAAFGTSGIFGLGFPSGSSVQEAAVNAEDNSPSGIDTFIESMYIDGPLLSRMSMTGELEAPMFAITLQRSTIDISGTGMLTVGKLPDGVDNSSLTWVPVRLYAPDEGGMPPPTFAPNEVYPFRWEVEIDGVFLDGKKLPDSTVPVGPGVTAGKTSALIDTGNSLLRGPADIVKNVLSTVSSTFAASSSSNAQATLPCNVPHTMAFQIGGKMFPVDPRDFIGQTAAGDTTTCVADNLVATDAPSIGALFSWSLGDPFLKSTLVAFHYGNLTHPSVDPPRMGFMTYVPDNADELLNQAISDAKANSGNFDSTLVAAPTIAAALDPEVTLLPQKDVDTATLGLSEVTTVNAAAGTTASNVQPTAIPISSSGVASTTGISSNQNNSGMHSSVRSTYIEAWTFIAVFCVLFW